MHLKEAKGIRSAANDMNIEAAEKMGALSPMTASA
jgi:hypothetical protein